MHFPEGQNKDAMPLQDQDVIREFLIESHENLARLDQEFVELEKHPKDAALLSSIFRTIHTIKGCCGFLGYSKLEKITHEGESILSELRDGRRDFTPSLASLILETVDAIRNILSCVEATGDEGADSFEELTERLKAVARQGQMRPQPYPKPTLTRRKHLRPYWPHLRQNRRQLPQSRNRNQRSPPPWPIPTFGLALTFWTN